MTFSRKGSVHRKSGFTLVELAVVLLVLAMLTAAATRYALALNDANNIAATNATLDVIETALMNFRVLNNRLPCPAVMNPSGENTAAFGAEEDTGTIGDGTCGGFTASGGAGIGWQTSATTDPYSGDSNYTTYYGSSANVLGEVVGGAVPIKALKIADKYAYDAWGRIIVYVVDKRYTATNAFTNNTLVNANSSSAPGVIVITPDSINDTTLASAITYRGIYALISYGENGHGGYVRNTSATPVVFNASSTNSDEQQNCFCNGSATYTAFTREFVQNSKNIVNKGGNNTLFDDIVRFKTRVDLASPTELQ